MLKSCFYLPLLIYINLLVSPQTAGAQSKVSIERRDGGLKLIRNGRPYAIRGVGGDTELAKLAEAGGNSIRTWGVDDLGRILDEAHQHGLTVCAGLWLGHQRHGFNYQDQTAVLKQLEESLAAVHKYKDHPALLLWGVGNEAEGAGTDPSVWYAINHVAREIKRIDPNHPTVTVIAEVGENSEKVRSIETFCPHIDIVGVNSYGGIESLAQRYQTANSTKPYIVTEHGTHGPWEVGKTGWGSPLEFSSTAKGDFYAKGYQANVIDNSATCLGSYAFLWGQKQETTATWFGMLLPDGTRLAAVDAMS
ncbi:MAG: glycoside hydrolase family 2 TIM barrel-domain containing protein, partial [Rubripirellula sp.]